MRTTRLGELVSVDAAARLHAFRRDVVRALPDAVEDVILFGSRARGDAQADSDYDVAVLLRDGLADSHAVRGRIADLAWDHLDRDVFIQTVPVNVDELRPASTELALRILADGVPVR